MSRCRAIKSFGFAISKGFDAFTGSLPEGVSITRRGNNGVASLVGTDKKVMRDFAKGKVPEGRVLLFEERRI